VAEESAVLCVRVPRERGERTRKQLRERGLVDDAHRIVVEDDRLFIPVTERPAGYEVVERPMPAREGQTLPEDLLGFAPSYERLGDIAIVDEDDPERARAIADALVDCDLPVESVLNRASEIQGELRVRDWAVLAGDTETVHREYGFEYALDLAAVYFSPRLATERHRVTEQVSEGEQVLDMFAGVGPFVIPAAARGATAVGVDLNERAIEYLRANAERNGVADRVTAVHGDVREVAEGGGYDDWADRLVMNLPHTAEEFLDTAVRLAGDRCTLHYYDIQPAADPFAAGERAVRAAAEAAGYDVTVRERRRVRSYAPGTENVRLDLLLAR
jgi:tRNA (guanine37-N1)-methyltransferase